VDTVHISLTTDWWNVEMNKWNCG